MHTVGDRLDTIHNHWLMSYRDNCMVFVRPDSHFFGILGLFYQVYISPLLPQTIFKLQVCEYKIDTSQGILPLDISSCQFCLGLKNFVLSSSGVPDFPFVSAITLLLKKKNSCYKMVKLCHIPWSSLYSGRTLQTWHKPVEMDLLGTS